MATFRYSISTQCIGQLAAMRRWESASYLRQTSSWLSPSGGPMFQDRTKFYASFGADLPANLAAFLADSQVPWGVDAGAQSVTEPAWRTKPSWYVVATEDHEIAPSAQRAMARRAGSTVVEVAESHAVYMSQPAPVADLIKQALSAVAARQ